MLEQARRRMRERYSAARLRETKFLMSFDLSKVETPIHMFYKKLEDREALVDPGVLTGEEII